MRGAIAGVRAALSLRGVGCRSLHCCVDGRARVSQRVRAAQVDATGRRFAVADALVAYGPASQDHPMVAAVGALQAVAWRTVDFPPGGNPNYPVPYVASTLLDLALPVRGEVFHKFVPRSGFDYVTDTAASNGSTALLTYEARENGGSTISATSKRPAVRALAPDPRCCACTTTGSRPADVSWSWTSRRARHRAAAPRFGVSLPVAEAHYLRVAGWVDRTQLAFGG
jgi:hypothetical protein